MCDPQTLPPNTQLTGLADAVYAEAFVAVHEYDIVLEILVINQTDTTMQNLMIELTTSGDLKIAERPQTYTLAPYDFKKITANIKVRVNAVDTITIQPCHLLVQSHFVSLPRSLARIRFPLLL